MNDIENVVARPRTVTPINLTVKDASINDLNIVINSEDEMD